MNFQLSGIFARGMGISYCVLTLALRVAVSQDVTSGSGSIDSAVGDKSNSSYAASLPVTPKELYEAKVRVEVSYGSSVFGRRPGMERDSAPAGHATISPDGKSIAFALSSGIYIKDLETDELTTVFDGPSMQPVWSPDGGLLAFYVSEADGLTLFVYDRHSGVRQRFSTQIAEGFPSSNDPVWVDNGCCLLVLTHKDGSSNATSNSSAQARPTVLLSGHETARVAPLYDRTCPAGDRGQEGFRVLDVHTGKLTTIATPGRDSECLVQFQLSASGRFIAVADALHNRYADGFSHPRVAITAENIFSVRLRVGKVGDDESVIDIPGVDYGTIAWHPMRDEIYFRTSGGYVTVAFDENGRTITSKIGRQIASVDDLYFTRGGEPVLASGNVVELFRTQHRPTRIVLPNPIEGRPAEHGMQTHILADTHRVLWQPTGHEAYVGTFCRSSAETCWRKVDFDTASSEEVWRRFAWLDLHDVASDEKSCVVAYEDAQTPPGFYLLTPDFSRKTRISPTADAGTNHGVGSVRSYATRVSLGKRKAAVVLHTSLVLPPGARREDRLPAVVCAYYGDESWEGRRFAGGSCETLPTELLVRRGYGVIHVDVPDPIPPEHRARLIAGIVAAQVARVAAEGHIDIRRLAMVGQSQGALVAMSVVMERPSFKACVAMSTAGFDLINLAGWMPGPNVLGFLAPRYLLTSPWDDLPRYVRNSPFLQAAHIGTPVLLMAGNRDLPLRVTESAKMFNALLYHHATAQLALYPDLDHDLFGGVLVQGAESRESVDAANRALEFLSAYLYPLSSKARITNAGSSN